MFLSFFNTRRQIFRLSFIFINDYCLQLDQPILHALGSRRILLSAHAGTTWDTCVVSQTFCSIMMSAYRPPNRRESQNFTEKLNRVVKMEFKNTEIHEVLCLQNREKHFGFYLWCSLIWKFLKHGSLTM